MKRLHSSSASTLNDASAWSAAETDPREFLFSATSRSSEASIWILAVASLVFATIAAYLMCLSPRWYSNRFISLVYEPARFVVLTALTGAAAIQIFWEIVSTPPAAGRLSVVRNLSGGWVFLPCFVLLYEQNSPWMLIVVALITLGTAFGLRRMLPAKREPAATPERTFAALPSLDGLPPADSPLLVASWIAFFAQATFVLAAGGALLAAAYAFSVSVFLFAWRWTASTPRAVDWWNGKHPPLRQAIAAILLTSFTLIPFSFSGHIGLLGGRGPSKRPPPRPAEANASSGYYGIILYPPPRKKEIVAPRPRSDAPPSGTINKPTTIPFDGQYWYYKPPNRRPGEKAHIAHGKPIDANINPHSTDFNPLQMEAHQTLPEPIDLGCCSEIDVAITNADTRPGEIMLLAVVGNSARSSPHKAIAPIKPSDILGQQTILSSQSEHIPADRAPVKEVLHFRIPPSRAPHQFDEITLYFLPAQQRARTGAKVSIDSFELIPKP